MVAMTYTSLQADIRSYLESGGTAGTPVYDQIPKLIDLGERRVSRRLKIQGFIKPLNSVMQAGLAVYAKPNLWRQTVSINFGQGDVWGVVGRSSVVTARTLTLDQPISGNLIVGQQVVISGTGAAGYDGTRTLTSVGYTSIGFTASPNITENVAASGYVSGASTLTKRTPMFARDYEVLRSYWPDSSQTGIPEFYADYDYQHYLFAPTPRQPFPWEVLSYMLPEMLSDQQQTNFLTQYAPNVLLYSCLLEAEPYLKEDARIQTWAKFYEDSVNDLTNEDLGKIMDRASQRTAA